MHASRKSFPIRSLVYIKPDILKLPIQGNIFASRRGTRNYKFLTENRPVRRRFAKTPIIQSPQKREHKSVTIVGVFPVMFRGPALLLAHLEQHFVPVLHPGHAGLVQQQTLAPLAAPVAAEAVPVELHDRAGGRGDPDVEIHRVVVIAEEERSRSVCAEIDRNRRVKGSIILTSGSPRL